MRLKREIVIVSLITSTSLTLFGSDLPSEMGTVSGFLRLGIISQENETSPNSYATAVGGILKYETPVWNDFKLGAAGYVSVKLPFASGSGENLNPDFFDSDGDSFIYLGEAYADYTANDISFRIGRQIIDIPFANADDIRMLPNTFEAAMATYSGLDKTILTAGFIREWAGYDSPKGHNDSINEFKKFGETHESNGAYVLGITNESIDKLMLQGWFYSIDEVSDIVYADAAYTFDYSDFKGLKLSAQAANFSEDRDVSGSMTGIEGNVLGLDVKDEWGMVTLGASFNKAYNRENTSVTNGLGSGPYYTSMEEWTIDGMEDAKAYRGSIALDLKDIGIEGLTISSAYGIFTSTPMDEKVDEWDISAIYDYNSVISMDFSYAMIDDKNGNADGSGGNAGYDRFLARFNYRF